MDLFLKILGIIFLCLVLLLVVIILGFAVLRARFRKMVEGFADSRFSVTPARLHLVPLEGPEWKDPEAVRQPAEVLAKRGFEEVGSFTTREMPFLRLRGFVRSESQSYAVVYEHDQAGVWMDYVSRYADGGSVTFSNSPKGGTLDQRPGHQKSYYPGEDAVALLDRFLAQRPNRPMLEVSKENFVLSFEKAYADEMDWRNARGYSEDEIRRTLEKENESVTDEQVQTVRTQMEAEALLGLNRALKERFLEETTLSIAEWEEVRDSLVFIHERVPRAQAAALLDLGLDCEDEKAEESLAARVPAGMSIREAFAQLNAERPAERRHRKLGELDQPIPADVYCSPEEEEEPYEDDD